MPEQIERQNNLNKQPKKLKTLLVEDNCLIQKIYKHYLEVAGGDVDVVSNGKDALKLFDCNYDIVILDIGLPDINGKEVCRKMREIDKKQKVHIILTSANDYEEQELCISCGANKFLGKAKVTKEISSVFKTLRNFIG
jgi:DNA-binding response OmpR family regulator